MAQAGHSERRRSARFYSNIPATVVFDDGCTRLGAYMRNLSETGAKIRLSEPTGLIGEVYMLIPAHRLQPCRLVWQSGDEVGLAFVD